MHGVLDEQLVRAIVGVQGSSLRLELVLDRFLVVPIPHLALALDRMALRAEQGDELAKEALLAVASALGSGRADDAVQRLREEVAGASLLNLERFLRLPPTSHRPRESTKPPRPPDYGFGRPLTLGERKSLARRHDRDLLEKLLGDPHPDVIRGLLGNPRLTEDDLVRLAARRPSSPDILAEIARSPRWSQRPRVRLTLLLNPDVPLEIATPFAGLLLRHELKLVAKATHVPPALRALCMEHLSRKYPHDADEDDDAPVQ